MARINVEDELWREFRVEAVRTETSVAAYLGVLVRREVARISARARGLESTGDAPSTTPVDNS